MYRFLSSQSLLTKRLLKGLGAQGFGKAVLTAQRLIEVPVLLSFWGTQLYGEWIMLATLPAYISLSDGGFTISAVRAMSARTSAGDRTGAISIFQSQQILLIVLSILMIAGSLVLLPFVPLAKWFSFDEMNNQAGIAIVQVFVLSVLVGFYKQLISGAFWCEGHYPLGMFISNLGLLMECGAFFIWVALGATPLQGALIMLLLRAATAALQVFILRRTLSWLQFGFRHTRWAEIKALVSPSLASTAIPLGFSLNIQGVRLIIGATFGAVTLVSFTALRTMTRVVIQLSGIINQIFQPEMAAAYGAKDIPLLRKLFNRSSQFNFWFVGALTISMAIGGTWLLRIWTDGRIVMDWPLYSGLLFAGVLNATWNITMVILSAANRHQKAAVAYFVIYGAFTLILVYLSSMLEKLSGIALALIVSEIAMWASIVPQALKMVHLSFVEWQQAMLMPPTELIKTMIVDTKYKNRVGQQKLE
ncbi:MAG: MATE family efflux transporter [Chloroflexi bacterium]|nr:MATE family efflux transporter [Chloroflexota bacterium]